MKTLITILAVSLSLSVSAQKTQCKGITGKGSQCSRQVVNNDFCFQHNRNHNNSAKAIAVNKSQCAAMTLKGTQCSRNTQQGKATCFQHSK